ncbi:MAG: NADH-quinone oxidoreductase subunit L [Clostridiales bacterium]|nr:NADH-quinone oxidoreductase subunit L [Clostridiales bacterium]
MELILFLIIFPLVAAIALLLVKADAGRDAVVAVASLVIAGVSIFLFIQYFDVGHEPFDFESEAVGYAMAAIEACLAVVIIVLGIKYKKYLASVLAAIQAPIMIWFEFSIGHGIPVESNIYVDKLSLIMILIIGVIGTLICVYSLPYMKDFQHHHQGEKDRRPWFFFLMFLFLAAMFGIVVSNNLLWMYFFWEITTLCSFFLIGYTKTEEAIRNSFRALVMNLLGGIGFVLAIVFMGIVFGTVELDTILNYSSMSQYSFMVGIPVALLAFAGITKAAQMPFNSWLLGAMVAPTPTSALLHSSTMVKAGVFLIIKLSPALGFNIAGIMVMMVGGITFLMASLAAISQSNAKRVLAYSTVANLGLIVACGGVGTYGAVWAGVMLIIFHAITKSLLFLCVGTAEHNIGSRDIEDMDGLFERMPRLAAFMMIGIAGMFLAPFGMLISKWATMTAFVESNNIILVMLICFGSAATLFYWAKWLGKMSAIMSGRENIQTGVHRGEWSVLGTLTAMTVLICLLFPMVSSTSVVPYIDVVFKSAHAGLLSDIDMRIMWAMLALVVLLTTFFFGRTKKKIVPIYMAGVNAGDNLTFRGAMEKDVTVSLRNWYMEKYFGEAKMNAIGGISSAAVIVVIFSIIIGVVLMMGGVLNG